MLSNNNGNYKVEDYEVIIFPTIDKTRPLFLFDPLKTITTLLATLSTLWENRTSDLLDIKMFRLRDLNILQGKKLPGDSHWLTIIAYCGGWLTEPTSHPCGTNPLVYGACESCYACGKLICPNCLFCSESCVAAKKRGINQQMNEP